MEYLKKHRSPFIRQAVIYISCVPIFMAGYVGYEMTATRFTPGFLRYAWLWVTLLASFIVCLCAKPAIDERFGRR